MSTALKTPKTLMEAMRYFDPERSFEYFKAIRWPDGVVCPCGSDKHSFISTRKMWQCKECKKQFSVKVGTIFEDSPIKLDKWLCAMWLIVNAKNGISSYEIARSLGVTQKTAWFMLHRIRYAMQNGSIVKLMDHVEVDETYIGGKAKNMHKDVREKRVKGTGGVNMTAVVGLMERGGPVIARVVGSTDAKTLEGIVRANVLEGSKVYTDGWKGYKSLPNYFSHQVIDHGKEYAVGTTHTNGIENFWALLKRTLKGTYVSVRPDHLNAYLSEQTFRYDERRGTDGSRFFRLTNQVTGKRLTYKMLTGKVLPS